MSSEAELARTTAEAVLGIDTLWGGDVMSASGTRRFIADSWFSDEPLPSAYDHPTANRLRENEGVAAREAIAAVAYCQNLYRRRKLGFESSVLTMNTRGAALMEGVANNAVLFAHGVHEPSELPDRDLELGTLLALLQDEAKNQSSYLTWQEGWAQPQVAEVLRRDFLCSAERAEKLSGAWGRHPLLGRMYLPCYRAGTQRVAELRRLHPDDAVLPVVFGCHGLADVVTVSGLVAAVERASA